MRLCHGQKTLLISNASGSLECLQVKLQSDIVHVSLHRLEGAFAIAVALAFVWNYRWACSAQGSVRRWSAAMSNTRIAGNSDPRSGERRATGEGGEPPAMGDERRKAGGEGRRTTSDGRQATSDSEAILKQHLIFFIKN